MVLHVTSSSDLEAHLNKLQRPITSLEFSQSTIDANGFVLLAKENLKRLTIQRSTFEFKNMEVLKLDELDASNNFFPVAPDFSKIQVKMLNLTACGLNHDNLSNILKNVYVRSLKLHDNNFSNFDDANAFEQNNVLQYLDVTDCKVGDKFLTCLRKSKSLSSLVLSYNQVSQQGATELLEALKKDELPRLVELKLLNNMFGNDSQLLVELDAIMRARNAKLQAEALPENADDDLLEYKAAVKEESKPSADDDDEELNYVEPLTKKSSLADLTSSMPSYAMRRMQHNSSVKAPVQRTESTISTMSISSKQLEEENDLLNFEEVRFTNVVNIATQVFLLPIILFLVIVLRQKHTTSNK